jgi:hypothetical protein
VHLGRSGVCVERSHLRITALNTIYRHAGYFELFVFAEKQGKEAKMTHHAHPDLKAVFFTNTNLAFGTLFYNEAVNLALLGNIEFAA